MNTANNQDIEKKIEEIRQIIHDEVEIYLDNNDLSSPELASKMISWENELTELKAQL